MTQEKKWVIQFDKNCMNLETEERDWVDCVHCDSRRKARYALNDSRLADHFFCYNDDEDYRIVHKVPDAGSFTPKEYENEFCPK